jgi:hypothetical protein
MAGRAVYLLSTPPLFGCTFNWLGAQFPGNAAFRKVQFKQMGDAPEAEKRHNRAFERVVKMTLEQSGSTFAR